MLFLTHHVLNVADIDADASDVIDVMSLTANSIGDDEYKSAAGMMIPPVRQFMNPENPTLIQFFTIYIMEPVPENLARNQRFRLPTLTQSVFTDFINSRFKTFN